jgi:two-component system chemotaxis response regulator CheY
MDRKSTILVIDDELPLQKMMENFLKEDYRVITKGDGKAALDWIQEGNIPDLIICDVNMEPMNGEEFVKNIRSGELFKYIPLLMLSGDEESKTRIKFYELGVKNFITKPFNPQELLVLTRLLLNNG